MSDGVKEGEAVHRILQIIGYVVIALMAIGIIYGNATAIRYWSGIGV